MKVNRVKDKVFVPMTFTIGLESQDEVDCLTAIFNTGVDNIRRHSPDVDRDILCDMQMKLWTCIHSDSTQR
jgi:imidazole glycerol phosphate synthase subunit HisF